MIKNILLKGLILKEIKRWRELAGIEKAPDIWVLFFNNSCNINCL
jgi:MoaA/NifB/PqqE/SkfB family radical SAM enzyme